MAAKLGHVEPFNLQTDDWTLYIERLGQYFVANDVTEDTKKVAILLTTMGSKAYELLHSLLAPEVPSSKKYDELTAVLQSHLKPKPLVIAERFKFHHRNQHDGETVAQYMAELRRLSQHCDFKEYLSEALRDRLVCGLRSEAIQRRLLSEKDLTLESAYDIAHGLETASQHASELQASAKTAAPSAGGVQRVAPRKPHDEGTSHSCHRCGKTGHPPERCYYRHQKCRACQRRGHIAKMCKTRVAPHGTSSPGAPRKSNRSHQPRQAGGSGNRTGYVGTEPDVPAEPEVPPMEPNCEALFAVTTKRDAPIILKPKVNGVELEMELDTGATVSLVSEKTWKEVFQECPLDKCSTLLKTYTGE